MALGPNWAYIGLPAPTNSDLHRQMENFIQRARGFLTMQGLTNLCADMWDNQWQATSATLQMTDGEIREKWEAPLSAYYKSLSGSDQQLIQNLVGVLHLPSVPTPGFKTFPEIAVRQYFTIVSP